MLYTKATSFIEVAFYFDCVHKLEARASEEVFCITFWRSALRVRKEFPRYRWVYPSNREQSQKHLQIVSFQMLNNPIKKNVNILLIDF